MYLLVVVIFSICIWVEGTIQPMTTINYVVTSVSVRTYVRSRNTYKPSFHLLWKKRVFPSRAENWQPFSFFTSKKWLHHLLLWLPEVNAL